MFAHIAIEIVKGLAWLAENLPDDPRLGGRLLLGGGILLTASFAPADSAEWGDAILIAKVLCVIAGIACVILGAFVFFRRCVWKRQEIRAPIITGLDLGKRHGLEKKTASQVTSARAL